jgi:hypothetical protein
VLRSGRGLDREQLQPGHQAVRKVDRRDDEHEPKDDPVVGLEGGQERVQPEDHYAADDWPDDRAHAPDHESGQKQRRKIRGGTARREELLAVNVHPAAEAGDHRGDQDRQKLGAIGGDSDRSRQLLARVQGDEPVPDPAAYQSPAEYRNQHDQREHDVVEPQPSDLGGEARNSEQRHAGLAAYGFPVLGDGRDGHGGVERDQGQIETADP